MFRSRYSVLLLLVGAAATASAADKAKHDGKAHGTPPVYEVFGEDENDQRIKKTYDLSKPDQAAAFLHVMQHGHVHEVTNVTPPTIKSLGSLRYDLGIWTLIIFFAFTFLAGKILWPTILAKFQAREASIRDAMTEAQKLKGEAQDLRASLQKQLDEAHLQVKALIDEAKRDAQATTEEMISKARADISTERDRLQRDIQTQTDQALQSLWKRAADLAAELSSTALRKQIDMPTHRRLIDEALTDIRNREAARHA